MAQKTTRPVASGYSEAGASYRKNALKGFAADSKSAQSDIDRNNYTLRQRARMLYMSAPLAASAIKTTRTNAIGVGLKLKPRVDRELLGLDVDAAATLHKQIEREWALWTADKRACDSFAVNNFNGLQQLAMQSALTSGDCFALLEHVEPTPFHPYGLRIKLIEADRIATPTDAVGELSIPLGGTSGKNKTNGNLIYDGVEIDRTGAAVAYWIRSDYPLDYETKDENGTKWTRVPVVGAATGLPNILQISEMERPGQYRGVTMLAQAIEPLLQLRRYTEAELTAAIIESFYTAFITTNEAADEMPFNETFDKPPEDGLPESDKTYPPEYERSSDPNDYELGAGTINVLEPGENVTFGDPKRPGDGYTGFVRSLAEQIGSSLEIPADLLMKSFNSSYSASRAALLEAWKMFRMRREWFVDDFCRPVYTAWFTEAVARGRIAAPGFFGDPVVRAAYLEADWIGPVAGQLDPVKEINAEILAVENGFSTRAQSTMKLSGGDYNANVEALTLENEALAKASMKKEMS